MAGGEGGGGFQRQRQAGCVFPLAEAQCGVGECAVGDEGECGESGGVWGLGIGGQGEGEQVVDGGSVEGDVGVADGRVGAIGLAEDVVFPAGVFV